MTFFFIQNELQHNVSVITERKGKRGKQNKEKARKLQEAAVGTHFLKRRRGVAGWCLRKGCTGRWAFPRAVVGEEGVPGWGC